MPHANPAEIWPAIYEATRVCNMRGDRAGGAEITDRIVPSDQRETAYALWHHMGLGQPDRNQLVASFDRLASDSSSALIAAMAAVARASMALHQGDAPASIESGRTAVRSAQALGSHTFAAMAAPVLGCALGLAQSTTREDLEVLRTTLAEQVRLGQETDQWLTLIGTAVAIHHLHDAPLAAAVQRGLEEWLS